RLAKLGQAFIREFATAQGNFKQIVHTLLTDEGGGAQAKVDAIEDIFEDGVGFAADFTHAIIDAAINAGLAGFNAFNPSLVVHGVIQPTIFGIPLGDP